MAFQDLVDFSGGINTAVSPLHVPQNQAITVTSCDISSGSIVASIQPLDLDEASTGTNAVWYDAQSKIVNSTEDRFYVEWGGFLYWSNPAGTIKRYNGTTTNDIGGWTKPTPTPALAVSANYAGMVGNYTYCYTYIHDSVFESAPSPYNQITSVSSKSVNVTFTDTPPSSATARIVYRLGGVVPTFRFIAEIPIATTTFEDKISDLNIDPYELVTFDNEPPKSGLDMLIENNGVFYASLGKEVYFSRQGTPEYWNEYNYIELPSTVKGLGKSGSSIIAFTDSEMYMISGSDLSNMSVNKLPFQYGCSNKFSVQNLDGMLIWVATIAGRVVVCSFDGQNVNIVSENHKSIDSFGYLLESTYNDFTTDTFSTFSFIVKNACVFNRKYYLNTNIGVYVFDFNNGFRITLTGVTCDQLLVRNSTLLALKTNKLYDMHGSYSGNLSLKYKTGLIVNSSAIANKSYRRVRTRGKGTFSITVIIDGVYILTSSLDSFYLPAEAVGTTIQFLIESTGYAEISAISYEYEVLAL